MGYFQPLSLYPVVKDHKYWSVYYSGRTRYRRYRQHRQSYAQAPPKKTRKTPYTANAAIPTVHKRPRRLPSQNSENSIVNPNGLSALKPSAWRTCPFASANTARVIPHNGQGRPVSQWNPQRRNRGSAGGV